MDLALEGKSVIITGGTGGIGRGLVFAFAGEGANVVSASLKPGEVRLVVSDSHAFLA